MSKRKGWDVWSLRRVYFWGSKMLGVVLRPSRRKHLPNQSDA